MKHFIIYTVLILLTACGQKNVKEAEQPQPPAAPVCPEPKQPVCKATEPEVKPAPAPTIEPSPNASYNALKLSSWSELSGIEKDNLGDAWTAWLRGCSTLIKKNKWRFACEQANTLQNPSQADILNYYVKHFDVYSARNVNGSDTGLVTGYYEPLLRGSLTPSAKYPYPLYKAPNDLISVNLSTLYPDLTYKRIRGRLVGSKLIPYYSRAEIDSANAPLAGHELVWVDDIIDAFFLQIQGSGVVQLESGEQLHVGYANQNGHKYKSIGKLLVQRGELKLSQASMKGIKNWGRNNTHKLRELLNSNPSYVFFRALPKGLPGPLGALGIPLTAKRSVAVDRKFIPLGAPLFLSTTYPNSKKPLKQLMMAQDTGGAIRNGVRADFYWGSGDGAGKLAGSMKQSGKIWVLLPKGFK